METNQDGNDLHLIIGVVFLLVAILIYKVGSWFWFSVILTISVWKLAFLVAIFGTGLSYLLYRKCKQVAALNKKKTAIL